MRISQWMETVKSVTSQLPEVISNGIFFMSLITGDHWLLTETHKFSTAYRCYDLRIWATLQLKQKKHMEGKFTTDLKSNPISLPKEQNGNNPNHTKTMMMLEMPCMENYVVTKWDTFSSGQQTAIAGKTEAKALVITWDEWEYKPRLPVYSTGVNLTP